MTGLRVAGLDAALLVAGLGVVRGAGLVASVRDAARLAGLAFLLGLAAVGALLTAALSAGASLTIGLAAGLAAATAVVGAAAGIRRPPLPLPAPPPEARWSRVVAGIAFAAACAYLLLLLRTVHAEGSSATWDAWGFWIPKAKTIFYFGGLDARPGGMTSFANPDYPPLLPAVDASVFRFAGRADATLLPVQEWLLLVAFLWAPAGLLRHRIPAAVLAVSALLFLLMPDVAGAVGSSLGDLPLSLLLGAAAVCLSLWLVERHGGYLVPAAVLLAGAAVTKKEGLALAFLLLVAAAVAARSVRRLPQLALPAIVALAAVVPWRLWLRAHDVVTSGDYRLHDAIDPGFLADRVGRLGTAADRVPQYLFDLGRWELVLPLALLASLLALRRARGVALLVLLTTALGLCGLVVVYWISLLPIEFHLESSAARTVMPLVVIGGALLPLVLAEALDGYARAASSDRYSRSTSSTSRSTA